MAVTRRFLNIYIYAIAFGIVLVGSGCESQIAEMQRELSEKDLQIERIEGVEILYSDSAIVRMRIEAPTLLNYIQLGRERKTFPDGLEVKFFDGKGRVTSTLTANYAMQIPRESRIIIQDKVVVKSATNETLETDELIWDEREKILYTDKWVKVTTTDELIYGYGFESNQDFTEWQINKVNGRFTVDNLGNDF